MNKLNNLWTIRHIQLIMIIIQLFVYSTRKRESSNLPLLLYRNIVN